MYGVLAGNRFRAAAKQTPSRRPDFPLPHSRAPKDQPSSSFYVFIEWRQEAHTTTAEPGALVQTCLLQGVGLKDTMGDSMNALAIEKEETPDRTSTTAREMDIQFGPEAHTEALGDTGTM